MTPVACDSPPITAGHRRPAGALSGWCVRQNSGWSLRATGATRLFSQAMRHQSVTTFRG
jgi:hypothetical protein